MATTFGKKMLWHLETCGNYNSMIVDAKLFCKVFFFFSKNYSSEYQVLNYINFLPTHDDV
jgi:hypothetical protein